MTNRTLLPMALALALAACATHAPPPSAPPTPTPVPETLLPPVPQPPERPLPPASVTDPALPREARVAAFVDYTAQMYRVNPDAIRMQLAQAQVVQRTLDIISRPAEAVRPWRDYRPIFVNDARIQGGIAFYQANRTVLDRIAAQTGVPAEYVVAIIGVETNYGKIKGSYRVLDVLDTLAFDYPKRAPFFAGELAQLFALGQDEHLDVSTLMGSYAGAMGWGQFMPSSYRDYAVDGDGDGKRDLFNDLDDVFASVANYFAKKGGWQANGPVMQRALRDASAADFVNPGNSVTLDQTLASLAGKGYRPASPPRIRSEDARVTLITLEGAAGPEYWIVYNNFKAITTYNISRLYATAVYQLSQSIAGQAPAAP